MRILVVDDEPAIRYLIERMLARLGHHILLAGSANEAAALLLDFPQPPDAAVLDVRLTGMSGVEFSKILSNLFPHVHLVFISGWPDNPEIAARPAGSILLGKPFSLSALLSALGADPVVASVLPQT